MLLKWTLKEKRRRTHSRKRSCSFCTYQRAIEFQLGQTTAHAPGVGQRGNGVEALRQVAVDLALVHHLEDLEHVVLLVELGQVVEQPVVLLGRLVAVPRLHQADVELRIVLPG